MKVVIDTNVLVSALLSTNGIPAKILALVLNGKLKILYDNRIIFEYGDVLSRKEFEFDREMTDELLTYVKNDGEYINAEFIQLPFNDEADRKFYEVYKSSEAQYLITGNIKHFPKETFIINPADFLRR
ncbi:MAG: putative toxin-antitoxin system toxin component, PIN family, partial [Treponema sp.]|nr:putative toxin-antitoxin system toxin component, PIN family [Treponema sp.]